MHDPAIDIAPAVARRIGPGNARLARRPAHPTYLCPGCGCRGSHTEPASLVILAADGLPDVARYAHPACMPSSVRSRRPAVIPPPRPRRGNRHGRPAPGTGT